MVRILFDGHLTPISWANALLMDIRHIHGQPTHPQTNSQVLVEIWPPIASAGAQFPAFSLDQPRKFACQTGSAAGEPLGNQSINYIWTVE